MHAGAGSGAGVSYSGVVHDEVDRVMGFLGVFGSLGDGVVVCHVEVD